MADFDLKDLGKPFRPDQLEWRIQRKSRDRNNPWAMVLVYVTARDVFDRLDEVVGPENWRNTEPIPVYGTLTLYKGKIYNHKTGQEDIGFSHKSSDLSVLENAFDTQENCLLGFNLGIQIKINGEWVSRYDGADTTAVEPYKGGISSAWKRAGVPWGIGRYLYGVDSNFAEMKDARCQYSKKVEYIAGNKVKWLPPLLPPEMLPEGYEGDQWYHLMDDKYPLKASSEVMPAQKLSEPEKISAPQSNELMKKLVGKVTDLRNKASLAQSEEDRMEIVNRLGMAKEYIGQKFADGSIDKNEMDQLTMLLKSVEDSLNE